MNSCTMSSRTAISRAQASILSARTAVPTSSILAGARPFSSTPSSFASSSKSVLPGPSSTTRTYTPRKTFLYSYYSHLLHRSDLVLLFSHANLTVRDLSKIRKAIKSTPQPPSSEPAEPATLTIARTGILSALSRNQSPDSALLRHLSGPVALITCPSLSPAYLSRLLAGIQRAIKTSKRDEQKGQVIKQPQLSLIAGVLEGTVMPVEGVEQVGRLDELDVLRGQVVGLLEMRGRELIGVLGQSAGGGLVRTLQGLELKMKEEQGEVSA